MSSFEDLIEDADVLESAAGIEAEASSLAASLRNLNDFAVVQQKDVLLRDMRMLNSYIGAEGRSTVSLGRPGWSLSTKSLVQKTFDTMLADGSEWAAERTTVINLRANVISRCAAEQRYVLSLMKNELKEAPFTSLQRELDIVNAAEKSALSNLESDIRDVDVCLKGMGEGRAVGKVLSSSEGKINMNDSVCAAAVGAYSRYLERGERSSLRLLEAADFVAGRRRRSPRRASYSVAPRDRDQHAALYGVGCFGDYGMIRFAPERGGVLNWLLGKSMLRASVNTAEAGILPFEGDSAVSAAVHALTRDDPEAAGIKAPPDGPPDKVDGKPNEEPNVTPETPPGAKDSPYNCGKKVNDACTNTPRGANGQDAPAQEIGKPPDRYPSEGFEEAANKIANDMQTAHNRDANTQTEERGADTAEGFFHKIFRKIGEFGEKSSSRAEKVGNFFRRAWTQAIYPLLKVCAAGFFALEVFNQMAQEKSGCYIQNLTETGNVTSSVKLCQDATWPSKLSLTPNQKIESNCQDCYQVYQLHWDPAKVPQNLLDNGCTDIGDPNARKCRATQAVKGLNYHWDSTTVIDAMGDTMAAMAKDLAACIECTTKLAAAALSGGVASIFAIIIILVILYVVRWIYEAFLK
jgi:hypothetical protein